MPYVRCNAPSAFLSLRTQEKGTLFQFLEFSRLIAVFSLFGVKISPCFGNFSKLCETQYSQNLPVFSQVRYKYSTKFSSSSICYFPQNNRIFLYILHNVLWSVCKSSLLDCFGPFLQLFQALQRIPVGAAITFRND